ncbi:hypothetical protein [Soonwooa sp.]|uniref:hypothetical protein n=1 Tax=Soonwooa sp. TaxID=1938592 RepID=UPI0026135640|nr:hypothetical protein [Soonwooa sp.]
MRNFSIFVFLFFFLLGFSQSPVKDSLEKRFREANTNHDKALAQMELSDYWSYRDTVKAFQSLKTADEYVQKDNFLKGLLLFYKAGVYFDHDVDKAQSLYKQADEKLKNYTDPKTFEYRAKLWHNYAVLQQGKEDQQDFLNITLEKCIPFAEKSGNKTLQATYLVDVGLVFANYREFPKAISYYNKSLEILKTAENKNEAAAWAYLNLANAYLEIKNLSLMNNALKNADVYLSKIPESQYNVVAYLQKSRYYNAIGNPKEALANIQKGIAFAKSMNLDYDYFNLSYEYSRLLKKQGQNIEAKLVAGFRL